MPRRELTTETQRHREHRGLKAFWGPIERAFESISLFRFLTLCLCVSVVLLLPACSHKPDPNTLVMIIESSPLNLDPRVGVDGQSQRIDELLFDPLLRHDDKFELRPALAARWETPDPLTYIFHLRHGVRFHNGQPLTSRDVKWTFDSLINGKIRSPKAGTFAQVSRIDAPDDYTVIFHLKQPYASL